MDLSIVVSTFNRAEDVSRLLESVARLQVPAGRTWELIVVDNNSTDDTREIVMSAAVVSPDQVRYLFEPRQGKSHGLNCGIAHAQGRVLAFTDDDAVVVPDWVGNILDFFDQHAEAVCVGGPVDLYNPADAPKSIRTSRVAARIGLAEFTASNIPIIGCNMALRASLISEIGAFDTDIGPGSKFGVAEDLDYLYRVVRNGHSIDYVPAIRVLHNHGRRSAADLLRLDLNYTTGRGAFYFKHAVRGDKQAMRYIVWELRNLVGWRILAMLLDREARDDLKRMWMLLRGGVRYLALRKSLPSA